MYVTTTMKSNSILHAKALELARKLGWSYISRGEISLGEDPVLVVSKQELVLHTDGERFFFHPSLAKSRIAQISSGCTDSMIQAMAIDKGAIVLDCTLGLATDALVASYIVGETGYVVGVESEPVIALIVQDGLANYDSSFHANLAQAFCGIKVVCSNYHDYLLEQEANSVDVVYFDPMFQRPVRLSNAIAPLRRWANHAKLNQISIIEACRVARQRVVIKTRANINQLVELGFKPTGNGKSRVQYGYIEV